MLLATAIVPTSRASITPSDIIAPGTFTSETSACPPLTAVFVSPYSFLMELAFLKLSFASFISLVLLKSPEL